MKNGVFFGAIGGMVLSWTGFLAPGLAGIGWLDSSGFLSLSPFLDFLVWGLCFGACVWLAVKHPPTRPLLEGLPDRYALPFAYGATWGILILLLTPTMGLLFLSFWQYAGVLAGAYLLLGLLWGRKTGGSIRWALLWGAGIALVLGGLGLLALYQADRQFDREMRWFLDSHWEEVLKPDYLSILLGRLPYRLLGHLNLPACSLLAHFEEAHAAVHDAAPRQLVLATCLLPPTLFTSGWLLGRLTRTKK